MTVEGLAGSRGADRLPIARRQVDTDAEAALPQSLHPVVRRVYAARGVHVAADCDYGLDGLLRPDGLGGLTRAAELLAEAIHDDACIVIAGDYDADGATSTALLMRGLRALGARRLDYVIPDRFTMGYGLSEPLVDRAAQRGAQLLVTVDSGIANLRGVAYARERGMRVVITDHHLPGAELPDADAIVNPNLPGDGFPSKHLAGVGVAFYLLAALRKRCPAADTGGALRLADLLDLVALGTVADVVPLDHNNRVLVAQGLARIRAGRGCAGIRALLQVAGRDPARIDASDLGFAVGPRLNAAGRLENMAQGVACLLADDEDEALALAADLDRLNRERRDIEQDMVDGADAARVLPDAVGLCLFDPAWHEGVVGLVASRTKQQAHRPVVAFAPAADGASLKGSARSIPGLHIRDAIAAVASRHPGLIDKFGGHAMAAGLSLAPERLPEFAAAFDERCRQWLDAAALEARIDSDGGLPPDALSLETARALKAAGPWGQAFPEPLFDDVFVVREARIVGEKHVRYRLLPDAAGFDGPMVTAIDFGGAERMATSGARVHAAYQLDVNCWQDRESLQLLLRALAPT